MEIWKDIKGYEGKYQVSSEGRIWSISRQKVLKPQTGRYGYKHVTLIAKNGKKVTELIHRLVAFMFKQNINNLPEINHIDENILNNSADNLEWCDRKYNINYGTHNLKMGESKAKRIMQISKDGTIIRIWNSTRQIERELGLSHGNISSCCIYYKYGDEWWKKNRNTRPLKSYKGFIWKFEE